MSNFDIGIFHGVSIWYTVSKEKYSKAEAISKFINDFDLERGCVFWVCDAFVRHRAGTNEEKEPQVGWWLENEGYKRSCEVWAFHIKSKDHEFDENYEYMTVGEYKVIFVLTVKLHTLKKILMIRMWKRIKPHQLIEKTKGCKSGEGQR